MTEHVDLDAINDVLCEAEMEIAHLKDQLAAERQRAAALEAQAAAMREALAQAQAHIAKIEMDYLGYDEATCEDGLGYITAALTADAGKRLADVVQVAREWCEAQRVKRERVGTEAAMHAHRRGVLAGRALEAAVAALEGGQDG